MPASSIDTFFACSIMVVLVTSAMIGTAKIAQPHIQGTLDSGTVEHYKALAEYILLNTGTPSEWGQNKDAVPSLFGLASTTQLPYELDLDKVTRLNGNNTYSVSYESMLAALGVKEMSLNIRIHPLFDISINMSSKQSGLTESNYSFRIQASRSGYPVETWLHCYAVIKDHLVRTSASTDPDGVGYVEITLPNSLNGTALLVAFARLKAHNRIVAHGAFAFGHNAVNLKPNHTFAQLNPINNVLNASYVHPSVNVSNAYALTCNHNFTLLRTVIGNQTEEYHIPQVSEASTMILVISGANSSQAFTEWVSYPQIPLEAGPSVTGASSKTTAVAFVYLVSVDTVLYKASITVWEVQS